MARQEVHKALTDWGYGVIRQLVAPIPPPEEPKKEIGFHMKEDAPPYRGGRKKAERI
jgi:hypothetical protein